jgi:PEP-CTERM motif
MRRTTPKRVPFRCLALPAFFALLFCGLSANAGTIVEGNVTINISAIAEELEMQASDQINIPVVADGSFHMTEVATSSDLWSGDIGAWGNVDPFTNLAFHVTNILAVPVVFTVSVTIPIAPLGPGTLHGGSTGGTTTDSNGNGVGGLSTVPGLPYYAGQIDGATVLSIYPDPTAFTFIFAGQTITIPALNPGLPGPTIPSGPALATIGIEHKFILSPGDSAAGTSFFTIEPNIVPEPSSIVLAVMGSVGLIFCVWRRRRRS